VLAGLALYAGTALEPTERTIIVVGPDGNTEVVDCASGCNAPHPSELVELQKDEFIAARDEWAAQDIGVATLQLDTLLFHGEQTTAYLNALGHGDMDLDHVDFLRTELERDTATVEFRMLDEMGLVRGTVPPTTVNLKEKNHLRFSGTGSLGVFETNGRTRRVGLTHLWSRW